MLYKLNKFGMYEVGIEWRSNSAMLWASYTGLNKKDNTHGILQASEMVQNASDAYFFYTILPIETTFSIYVTFSEMKDSEIFRTSILDWVWEIYKNEKT